MLKNRSLAAGLSGLKKNRIRVPAQVALPEVPAITMGTKILRPVSRYEDGHTELLDIEFLTTDTKYSLLKAARYVGNPLCYYTEHWLAVKPSISKSMVCFCAEEIPANWIYFVVTGLSKNKNCVFVRPVVGTLEDLLSFYTFDEGALGSNVKHEEQGDGKD